MDVRMGSVLARIIWNHPVWALTYGRWRYTPEDDERRWFARLRLGPWKIEAVAW